ncbi:isoleucine--tRNA ligase [Edaphobacter acidisoli]|uniref:Isoleucine--tRNA ligase n=1 Tax=Edaphobacter acidisoli TaxID=2040573 RepID=A0A916W2C0_9BACT|nr:isoleucine--tRNA ligase [Edaphobacter acidisoli]GGA60612.1 isoleucine--tRNA ligase [Edaphobacter acidisoli]
MPETPVQKPVADQSPAQPAKALKSTLNLPQTPFAMKANLPVNEPIRLESWQKQDLYGQIRAARAGAPRYILHDGPPYANGAIHLGHALNKCIKDFVVKTKTMAGFDAPYVPGWDCHGLPIEIKVDEQLGRKKLEMDPIAVRRACREYAQKYVDLQRSQFERIGVFGRWNDPYLTMSFQYEAAIAETFYDFFENNFVYKGLKPVYWCIHDRTALAEAEVEYEQHTSPSVYVRYKLTSDPTAISPKLSGQNVYTIIWTTTPWTLPASQAVAFNPILDYVALKNSDGATYIVLADLAKQTAEACDLDATEIARFKGSALEHTTFQHPFLDRQVLGVVAPYVTAEQGTGAVHTAPAHGVDDFYTGKRYNLPEIQYVDNAGRHRHTAQHGGHAAQPYEDQTVFKSNPTIIEVLREKGALLSATEFQHSYPHCWRCHNPVIVRATEQWFIGMETPMFTPEGAETTFRQRALDEIKKVKWDPAWGEERISNMIATRPDWCISRQRIWGVPIAVFLCEKCGTPLNDKAINKSIVDLFHKEGADAWYTHDVSALLPAGTKCTCGHTEFRKEMDILDVWFESGASWHAVVEQEPTLRPIPVDLYTEGGDQHRGWFHSSLLCAVGMRGIAPYKMVATSGWTLDEQGRAFSKSLGNGVDPVDIAKRLGGEIVRLWVASVDFREDVAASENLMQRVSDNYRKLRNTLRFLLSNLSDFDPATNAVKDFAKLEPLDQYILAKLAQLTEKIRTAYDEFEFHRAYHALNEFTNTDLSALYLDVLKDRLYTFAPNHPARRSAQTALWRIAETLTRLIAPILSFTADEVWQLLPKIEGREPSVHLALFPNPEDFVTAAMKEELLTEWQYLLGARTATLEQLEHLRKAGSIGKGLDAAVQIESMASYVGILEKYQSALPELFNVSSVSINDLGIQGGAAVSFKGGGVYRPIVERATGTKCERCWRYTSDVGKEEKYPTVCLRCAEALTAINFPPYS